MLTGGGAVLENKIQILTKLGITGMQAKTYIFLDALGKAHAKTLSRLCKLPKQDIYKTLAELYEIGLVEKTLTRPVEFRAIPPDKCLSLLIQRQKQVNSEIEQVAKKVLASPSKVLLKNDESGVKQLLLVPRREPTLYKALDLINSARHTICVVSPHQNLFPWIDKENKAIEKALARNVTMRLITDTQNSPKPPDELRRIFQNGVSPQIRYLNHSPAASFGIYDYKKLILELSTTDGFVGSDVIVTENPSMIEMASTYFKVMWTQAK